jgi:hypothetical protein
MSNVYSIHHANCFTVERKGEFTVGIETSQKQESGFSVHFSKRSIPCHPQNQCHFAPHSDSGKQMMLRARLGDWQIENNVIDAFTAINPYEPKFALVKANLYGNVIGSKRMDMLKRQANTYSSGVYQNLPNCVLGYGGSITLTKVLVGEPFSCFFGDGQVRTFMFNGLTLIETKKSKAEMVQTRIDLAWRLLSNSEMLPAKTKQAHQELAMLQVLNLLFYFHESEECEECEELILKFFSDLPREIYTLVEGRVKYNFYLVNKSLLEKVKLLTFKKESVLPVSNVYSLTEMRKKKSQSKK